MKWMPYGPRALLFQFSDHVGDEAYERGRAITNWIEQQPPRGLAEFVPAFTTLLLEFDPAAVPDPSRLAAGLAATFDTIAATTLPPAPIKEIPVQYNGPDIGALAAAKGLSPAEVARLHSAPVYKVCMLGFSPGFPYLGGLDPALHTPRRASPRPRVPAGSVAIGGEHTGIYTVDSPGGWNIIGHASLNIFDPKRGNADEGDESMFFLRHGDRVKFVEAGRSV